MDRREFLKKSSLAVATLPAGACVARPFPVRSPYGSSIPPAASSQLVNDIHSQLNATRVDAVIKPGSVREVQEAIINARRSGKSVCIAGGRHAMGGQ